MHKFHHILVTLSSENGFQALFNVWLNNQNLSNTRTLKWYFGHPLIVGQFSCCKTKMPILQNMFDHCDKSTQIQDTSYTNSLRVNNKSYFEISACFSSNRLLVSPRPLLPRRPCFRSWEALSSSSKYNVKFFTSCFYCKRGVQCTYSVNINEFINGQGGGWLGNHEQYRHEWRSTKHQQHENQMLVF